MPPPFMSGFGGETGMSLLDEAKVALRVTEPEYDNQIFSLLESGRRDLEIAGVQVPMDDDLIKTALFTYVRLHFGDPPNPERLRESYETQKVQLMYANRYTDYSGVRGGANGNGSGGECGGRADDLNGGRAGGDGDFLC